MKKIQNGDTVTVNYTLKLSDGTVFDSSLSEGRTPLSATLGQNMLIKGFENGLIDMSIGEKKTITMGPGDAYGEKHDFLIADVPKENLPSDVKVGDKLEGRNSNGQPVVVTVTEVKEETVTVDGNHPLAGQSLTFDVEVLEIQ